MANVTAAPSPIIVDKTAGQTKGSTGLKYEKQREQELWERYDSGAWSPINPHVRLGLGDEADVEGAFPITLKPGQSYELGVFDQGHGPTTSDPIERAAATVFCLWKKPQAMGLITDENRAFGGTWYSHQIHTNVPTRIVEIGVSRMPSTLDVNGLPHFKETDGAPTVPLTASGTGPVVSNDHKVELNPLLPGNLYFFAVIVTDANGNWDVRQETFTTLLRKLTVEFPAMHIYNDGDSLSYGEGEFWFEVYSGSQPQRTSIAQFYRPTADIDDWNETDRPYPLGYAHVGQPEAVSPEQARVFVSSRGVEHDGALESDEGAWSKDKQLFFPAGRLIEKVVNQTLLMDCAIATDGDDFHYGVDVRWSVEYV